MAVFKFETISAQEAAGFSAADSLQFDGAGANQVTVLYAADHVNISFAGRAMDFGVGIMGQTGTRFADGSTLYVGGTGADTAAGTAFGDGLYGGTGGDTLDGGDGGDLLQGNQGADSLMGGAGSDAIYGGQDDDQIRVSAAASGAGEANFANGNKGDDIVVGGAGLDTLLGGQGNDVVAGGDGGDFVNGNLGDDILSGDGGDDTVSGEGGTDYLTGGDGQDLFVFAAGSSSAAAGIIDSVLDWTSGDRIHVEAAQHGFASISAPMTPGYSYGGYNYGPMPGDESFSAMMTQANATLAADPALGIVAAKTAFDVIVFVDVDGDHMADLAIQLANATLSDISATNFV